MANETEHPIDIADPFARRLIAQYLDRRRADIDALRAALSEDRFDEIRVSGHNMSGSGSAYGLDRVSAIGAGLEDAARNGDSTEIERLLEDLDRFVRGLRLT